MVAIVMACQADAQEGKDKDHTNHLGRDKISYRMRLGKYLFSLLY